LPSLGESSSPRMESSVDFPQPEGPAMEMYVPFLISRCISDKACVSTSSVKKTFFTPSILINVPFASAMYPPLCSVYVKITETVPRNPPYFVLISRQHQKSHSYRKATIGCTRVARLAGR